MDGLRLDAGLFGHALRGASGRRGEQDFRSLGGENAQNRVEQGRLANARAAGDHHRLGAQRHFNRRALRRRQHLARLFLDPGQGLLHVDRRPGQGASDQCAQPFGHAALGDVKPAQENARLAADRVADDLGARELVIERRPHKRFVDVEELGGEGDEIVDRKPAVTVVGRLLEGEGHTGAQPLRRFAGHAHFHGHRVGRAKADASDIAGEPIRILGHHLNGVVAIGLEDAHRARRSNTMGMQKHHDVANGLLLGPAGGDFSRAELSDPRHIPQLLGGRFDDFEGS